jgi:6-pyruvoyl-tetrahydropterin synthase
MVLSFGQRLDFVASHRPHDPDSTPSGHNYRLWAEVTGPIRPSTGLILPHTLLDRALANVGKQYDHQDFTEHLLPGQSPLESLAHTINTQVASSLKLAQLSQLEISHEGGRGIRQTSSANHEKVSSPTLQSTRHPLPAAEGAGGLPAVEGRGEGELSSSDVPHRLTHLLSGGFSAAHRAHAPRLTDEENRALFGTSNNPAGHGHNYRVEIESPAPISAQPAPWASLDHLNLSHDVPELAGRNAVTETVAELLARRTPTATRVRVWESPDLFAVYEPISARYQLGRRYHFHSAHSLSVAGVSSAANLRRYGRCALDGSHGHAYTAYAVVEGDLDPLTDTVFNLAELDGAALPLLRSLEDSDLNDSLPEFKGSPATVEQAALAIWRRLEDILGAALVEFSLYDMPYRRAQVKRGSDG